MGAVYGAYKRSCFIAKLCRLVQTVTLHIVGIFAERRSPNVSISIVLDERGVQVNFFLFRHENRCCEYSLEAPQ